MLHVNLGHGFWLRLAPDSSNEATDNATKTSTKGTPKKNPVDFIESLVIGSFLISGNKSSLFEKTFSLCQDLRQRIG